jgi:ketosteroid isomerase-like protein
MIDSEFAAQFAREWAQAWNDHDLDQIMSHYALDVEFHSPRIRQVTGEDTDMVQGKKALRAYWEQALAGAPDLYFEIDNVFLGSDAVTVTYTNHRSQTVAETFVFNRHAKVRLSIASYAG